MTINFKNLPKKTATFVIAACSTLFMSYSNAATDMDNVQIQIGEQFAIPQVDAAALEVLNQICPQLIGKNKNFDTNYDKFLAVTFPGVSNPKALVASFKNDPVYIEAFEQAKADAALISVEETRQQCLEVATYDWSAESS